MSSNEPIVIPPELGRLDPQTRQRIEQAVLDIFSEREFHRVGLIEIARGANVSLQTIYKYCLLYTSPSPRDRTRSRMPSSA